MRLSIPLPSWLDRSRLLIWLIMIAAGGAIGYFYVTLVYPPEDGGAGNAWLGLAIGTSIGGSIGAFELFFVTHPYSLIRRLSFIPAFMVRVMVQFLLISLSIAIFQFLYDRLYGTDLFQLTPAGIVSHLKDVSFSLVASAAIVFYMQMRMYLGAGNLWKLLLGVYYRPTVEDRIFMILDIPGTTRAAQHIGDTAFHRYLNQLFVLFDRPIVRNGGEVHSYVGDAVIAVWPLRDGRRDNSRVLAALGEVVSVCEAESDRIEARFGIRPGVRAAINGGSVVIGETGDSKRQITYLGDVLNIASRIESKTKELDRPLLIASELLERMQLPAGMSAEPVGEFEVKGSRHPLALTELRMKAR